MVVGRQLDQLDAAAVEQGVDPPRAAAHVTIEGRFAENRSDRFRALADDALPKARFTAT
jgi:hypothetical protein